MATSASTADPSKTSSSQPHTILIINGPNLNLLGHREPSIYGTTTLSSLNSHLTHLTTTTLSHYNLSLSFFQSNHEGAILDRLHTTLLQPISPSNPKISGIIVNPGALTHTSVALRDALLGISIPFVEVHITNVHAREEFRHKSFLSDRAEAVICGLGVYGYVAALEWWGWRLGGGGLERVGVYGADVEKAERKDGDMVTREDDGKEKVQ